MSMHPGTNKAHLANGLQRVLVVVVVGVGDLLRLPLADELGVVDHGCMPVTSQPSKAQIKPINALKNVSDPATKAY